MPNWSGRTQRRVHGGSGTNKLKACSSQMLRPQTALPLMNMSVRCLPFVLSAEPSNIVSPPLRPSVSHSVCVVRTIRPPPHPDSESSSFHEQHRAISVLSHSLVILYSEWTIRPFMIHPSLRPSIHQVNEFFIFSLSLSLSLPLSVSHCRWPALPGPDRDDTTA